jgi:arylsulfatase A-like enzyme
VFPAQKRDFGGNVLTGNRPNIIQVTCHDLGRFLGCYGIETVRTPNLDLLAASGVRFERAFCTAPQCSPSRAALATGRFPHSNGVMGLTHGRFGWDLHPGEQTIAELLGGGGYETHLFGLQHVSPHAERLGFQHIHREGFAADVAGEVAAFLRNDIEEPERPLYLEINLREPHRPYDQGGVEPDASAGVTIPAYLPDTPASREEFAALQGAIHVADDAVGVILAALNATGLAETTLFLFTTDHGVAMPRAKCTLYDPGIGVALMVRGPGAALSPGAVVDPLISNVDVLPTLLAAAGVSLPDNLQGRSFLPLLQGKGYEPRAEIFAEKTYHSYYDPMRGIRTERHKYIRNFSSAFLVEVPGDVQRGPIYRTELQRYVSATHPAVELYDLSADPFEQHNLAGDPEAAPVERELDDRLWRWMEETGDPLLKGPVASPAYRQSMEMREG